MRQLEDSNRRPASHAYREWLRQEQRRRWQIVIARAALLAAFLALWEGLARAHVVNPTLTSYPSALWPTFVSLLQGTAHQPGLLAHAWSTAAATLIGFVLASAIGVVVASLLWWWEGLYKVLDPYLVVANAMPKTAFVPIFYIWLGPTLSIYGMSLAIALFVTILMIYAGLQEVDPNKIKLARTFGASKWQILAKIVLPGSVPTMIAALKVNAGLSLVGVVVGEFQSGNVGLGYLIQYGSQIFKMNIVMTAVVLLALISSILYLAIARLETAVMRRR